MSGLLGWVLALASLIALGCAAGHETGYRSAAPMPPFSARTVTLGGSLTATLLNASASFMHSSSVNVSRMRVPTDTRIWAVRPDRSTVIFCPAPKFSMSAMVTPSALSDSVNLTPAGSANKKGVHRG